MIRRLIFAAALFLLAAPAAAQVDANSIRADIAADLPDNMTREISPADLRGVLLDIVGIIHTTSEIDARIPEWAREVMPSGFVPAGRLAAGGSTNDVLARTATGTRWLGFGPTIDGRIADWAQEVSPSGTAPANRIGAAHTGAGQFLMSAASSTASPSWAFLAASDIRSGNLALARLPICANTEILKRGPTAWACAADADTDTDTLPALWALRTGASTRAPLTALPAQLARIPVADCAAGEVWKRGSTIWGCAADAVGAGGGIDLAAAQNAARALIEDFAEVGQTNTIPLARLAAGGNTGDLIQRTATSFQWASQTNAVDARVFSWARANAGAGDLVPGVRIDNALARDGELIADIHHSAGATTRGAVLVSEGATTTGRRSRTDYDWRRIMLQ